MKTVLVFVMGVLTGYAGYAAGLRCGRRYPLPPSARLAVTRARSLDGYIDDHRRSDGRVVR